MDKAKETTKDTTVIEKSELVQIYNAINEVKVNVAELTTILKLRKQPCQWHDELQDKFDKHIEEHKQNKRDTKQAAVQIFVAIISSGIITLLGMVIGMRIKG